MEKSLKKVQYYVQIQKFPIKMQENWEDPLFLPTSSKMICNPQSFLCFNISFLDFRWNSFQRHDGGWPERQSGQRQNGRRRFGKRRVRKSVGEIRQLGWSGLKTNLSQLKRNYLNFPNWGEVRRFWNWKGGQARKII